LDEAPALTANEINNWIAIYAATAICCGLAFVLSVSTVGTEVWKERSWREVRTVRSVLLFGPKLWWRWQKRYLFSTPATLAIVSWFALTLDWSR
jgi:hypothetical protein